MAFDEAITGGTTSKIIEVMVRDSSTGGGKTGIAHGSVTASYVREGGTRTAITLASGTAGDSYSSGKWCEVDATNQKGLYQFHVPNAAIASGVAAVTLSLQASGMLDKSIRLKLETPVNITQVAGQTASAAATVDFDDIATIEAVTTAITTTGSGLSAIPWNSAWDAEVQSEVADALTAFAWSGITISAVSGAVGSVTGTVGGIAGTITTLDALDTAQDTQHGLTRTDIGNLNDIDGSGLTVDLNADQSSVTIGTVTTNSDMRGTDSAFLAASAPANFSALGVNASGHISRVTLVDTTTTNADMRGTDGANTTAPDNASIAAILVDTGTTIPATLGTPTDTDLATDIANIDAGSGASAAEVRAEMDSNSTKLSSIDTNVSTLVTRIPAALFNGITSLASWLGLGLGKTADASTLAEVNATTAGAGYDNTTDSQEATVDRGNAAWTTGSVTGDAIITPLTASEITRVSGTDIAYFVGETISTTVAVTDSSGSAVDLSAKTLQVVIDRGRSGHSDVQVISSGSISVGGASNNQATFTNSAAVTNTAGTLRWALRDTADGDRVLARGNIRVLEAAEEDG